MSNVPDPNRAAVGVEIYEERDWEVPGRLLGTFCLLVDYGRGDEWHDYDPLPDYESFDEEDYWDDDAEDYDWPALEARQAEARREAEARAQADPDRRLTIEEAIARAHTYVDEATIWLDNVPWATREPLRGRQQLWPPDDLDLRPRWDYEPAVSPLRPDAWWVGLNIEAHGLTEALALAAVRDQPGVLMARRRDGDVGWTAPPRKWLSRQPARTGLAIDALVAASDEAPVTEFDGLSEALDAQLPEPPDRAPWFVHVRAVARWLRRGGRGPLTFWFTTEGLSFSIGPVHPATSEEVSAARSEPGR